MILNNFAFMQDIDLRHHLGASKQLGRLPSYRSSSVILLQIMKAHYLEMLHAKFEVSKSNSMVVRELKVTLQKLAPPPPPPPPVTPSLI